MSGTDAADGRPVGLGRGFWTVWSASALTNTADGVIKVALPLVAVRTTSSPVLIAGLGVAVTLPWLLFALPAGAVVDRADRRVIMVAADAVRAAVLAGLVLAVTVGGTSIGWLYLAALALGTAETLHDTAAQAVVPQLVPQGSLSRANGRLQAVELATNQFIGPPVGGLLVGVGVLLAFAGPAAVFAAAAGALLLLRGHFRVHREHSSTVRADIAEGVRFLARHRLLRRLAGMTATFNLATSATFAVFVLYAVRPTGPVGLTPTGYGVLLSLLAAGTVAGALLAGRIEARLSRSRCLLLGILGGVLMIGAPAVTSSAVAIGAAFVLGGGALALWNVVVVSLRQRLVPERLLGRVTSAYRLLAWGTQPLGAGAAGVLGELLGLRAVFLASVTVALLTLLGLKGVTDESIAEAERRAGD